MDQVERLRAELAEARRQARTDPLTEAWNRRAIIDLLYRELERARREGGRVGVLFVDLDRFKRINDSRGHAAGDAVLREAVARMRAAVRPYDPVGRYGGDEFVVIVAGAGAERGAERAATAIAAGLRCRPVATPTGAVPVTASIGVAVAPAGARDPERLIAAADRAMYAAKRAARLPNGRGGVHTVPPTLLPRVGKEQHMARTGAVTFKGAPLTLAGPELTVGQQAPDFTLRYFDDGLQELRLADLKGRPVLISVVPSLDTPVCATQTRRFDGELADNAGRINAVTVSCDLPFAQARFCGSEDIANMRTASDYWDRSFGAAWGTLVEELRILARAVYVLDADGAVVHAQVVAEMTDEPDYAAALAALRSLLR